MINIFQPTLGIDELKEIESVFKSNWIGKGDSVKEFENQFALHLDTSPDNFTSTTSGSEALFLAGDIFGFNEADEIIVPSISFIAAGTTVLRKNAKLVLCEVDRRTLNVTAEHILNKVTKRTKAVIINHYGGFPCNMDPIIDICESKRIILIEDSACATKSFYKGKACGTLGDMGIWSFGAMKVICTGDGGMIFLKSKEQIEVANELLYHGFLSKQKSGMDTSKAGENNWWEIEINRFGRREIMNNVSGAMGIAQLKKLDRFISRKKEIFETYLTELSDLEWLTLPPKYDQDYISSYYFFWLQLKKRNELAKYLFENGVYSTFRYWPLHKIGFFKINDPGLTNSEYVCQNTLNIPLHQSLTDNDIAKIIDLIKKFGSRFI